MWGNFYQNESHVLMKLAISYKKGMLQDTCGSSPDYQTHRHKPVLQAVVNLYTTNQVSLACTKLNFV